MSFLVGPFKVVEGLVKNIKLHNFIKPRSPLSKEPSSILKPHRIIKPAPIKPDIIWNQRAPSKKLYENTLLVWSVEQQGWEVYYKNSFSWDKYKEEQTKSKDQAAVETPMANANDDQSSSTSKESETNSDHNDNQQQLQPFQKEENKHRSHSEDSNAYRSDFPGGLHSSIFGIGIPSAVFGISIIYLGKAIENYNSSLDIDRHRKNSKSFREIVRKIESTQPSYSKLPLPVKEPEMPWYSRWYNNVINVFRKSPKKSSNNSKSSSSNNSKPSSSNNSKSSNSNQWP